MEKKPRKRRTAELGVVKNPEGAPTKLTPEVVNKLLEAMDKSGCNISYSCKAAGISRNSYYLWMKESPEFAEKINEFVEANLDYAESKLKEHIAAGGVTGLTALIFFLKTKAKARGYVERVENVNANMNLVWNEEKTYERSRPINENG